ncbi:hypothetical protein SDC9_115436 [bioreactor metagenome]|uniref:Uncharacterized protein n=1 Tax=bioreactor metagenome TaxID=1076179 RepID=A0A645BZG7_9ZZZZ
MVVLINQVPIVPQVPNAVSHGVCIFTQYQRTGVALIYMTLKCPDTSIHRAVDIGFRIITPTFVLHRPGWVIGFGPVINGFEMLAIPRFIPKRPGNNGCEIAIAEHHPTHTLHKWRFPVGIVCQGFIFVVHHAVAFDIGFIHQVQSKLIAESVPFRAIWIMTCPHRVDIKLLHQPDVFYHAFHGDRTSGVLVMFVTINSFKQNRYAVYQLHTIFHLNRSETKRMDK